MTSSLAWQKIAAQPRGGWTPSCARCRWLITRLHAKRRADEDKKIIVTGDHANDEIAGAVLEVEVIYEDIFCWAFNKEDY